MKRSIALLAVAWLSVGCAVGRSFPTYRAKELVKGKTTEEQALKLLGEPYERFTQTDRTTWLYFHAKHTTAGFYFLFFSVQGVTAAETLRLRLDFQDGILQDYDFAMSLGPPGSTNVETYHGIPEKYTTAQKQVHSRM